MSTVLGKIGAVVTGRRVDWMHMVRVRRAERIPAAIVLVVMLAVGSRLITISVQQHAAEARASTEIVVGRYGRAIESRLQDLVTDARRPASPSLQWGRKTFRLTADGTVTDSEDSDAAIVQAVMKEWASADSHSGAATAGYLGPIRYGSQWLVAVRVPVMGINTKGVPQQGGWSIAYQALDGLLSSAGLSNLARDGYDFELSQRDPTSRRSRVLWSSSAAQRLAEPITRPIRLPADLPQSVRGAELTIAARPQAGWYPAGPLVADTVLLVVATWLLTLGAYDVIRDSNRLRAALTAGKRRLQAVNRRLTKEIEQRQTLQKSFDHARYHDAFTGLPNRGYFVVQLERALRELRTRQRYRIAIVLIDIDRFRLINDTLGHTAGDEVMVQAARRFELASAGFEGVLARWGGDQFALLLFDVHSSDTAISVAKLLRASLRSPFKLRKHHVSIAARVGVTCVEVGSQRAEDVLREADIALSMAKSQDDTPVVAYDSTMGGDVLSLVSLEADLHVALERDELLLLFQPIVDLREGHIIGVEALLRWRHPVEGMLRPDRFLAIAEEAGLTVPITRWTIEHACRVVCEWRRRLPPQTDFCISINLSAAALRDPSLVDHVASVLEETSTPARALKFELTESGLISNIGAAKETLERLHEMGIQLMLDDFGTGYSSLTHLQLFPFDYVKIDRPLANRSGSQQADHQIMSAMVRMVSSLGLKTIGEVVETEAGAEALQRAGCDFGQGYFFCEPVESEEALRHLRAQDLRVPRAPVNQHRGVSEEVEAPAETGSGTEMGGATVPPADVVDVPIASGAHDNLPTAVEPTRVSEETVVLPVDDFPTPVKSDETQVLPVCDSPTPAKSDETQVLPVCDSPTPAKSDETQVLPPIPLALPTDDSPTLLLSLDELALPIDDSPTFADPAESASAPESRDESLSPSESMEPDVSDAARNDAPGIRRAGRRRAR
jgi:diguanylate cyclase (GGDEF)-like protein